LYLSDDAPSCMMTFTDIKIWQGRASRGSFVYSARMSNPQHGSCLPSRRSHFCGEGASWMYLKWCLDDQRSKPAALRRIVYERVSVLTWDKKPQHRSRPYPFFLAITICPEVEEFESVMMRLLLFLPSTTAVMRGKRAPVQCLGV
jgi:hypothetical protein